MERENKKKRDKAAKLAVEEANTTDNDDADSSNPTLDNSSHAELLAAQVLLAAPQKSGDLFMEPAHRMLRQQFDSLSDSQEI
ncbi:hypothetical protein B2J93_8201 [Marssonina coronariae]|uniref:Uncharacterized protein n=1 Tax=Diplocarpon coronariae TaxID=2795749 RepID=A0A218YTK9_9HELO|nr:hypothetical protein B2J93_8201 [Marssonina coronariae]